MEFGLLMTACLTASVSPGPAVLSTLETSLRHGPTRAFWHTLGLVAGLAPHVLTGLAASIWVLGGFPVVRALVALAGAVWFGWLAWGLLLRPRAGLDAGEALDGTPAKLFARGLLVNLANPKSLPWMLAIIQLARVPTDAFSTPVAAGLLGCMLLSELGVMTGYALLAATLRPLLRSPAVVRNVDRGTGVLWLTLGGLLLAQAWKLFT